MAAFATGATYTKDWIEYDETTESDKPKHRRHEDAPPANGRVDRLQLK